MADVAEHGTPQAIAALAGEAATAAADAVENIARELGAATVPGPGASLYPESPADALRIARQLEHATRAEVRVHVRRARESGLSWHAIGALLGFGEICAGERGPTVAEAAYDYAIGPRTMHAWFPDRSAFCWDCPACGQPVADHGPEHGPRLDEDGHAPGCGRLDGEAAEWDAGLGASSEQGFGSGPARVTL